MTRSKRESIFKKYGGRCAYCGNKMSILEFTVDHVKPISAGGSNDLSNLLPSCFLCNRMKGSKSLKQLKTDLVDKLYDLNVSNSDYQMLRQFKFVREANVGDIKFYFEKVKKSKRSSGKKDGKYDEDQK